MYSERERQGETIWVKKEAAEKYIKRAREKQA